MCIIYKNVSLQRTNQTDKVREITGVQFSVMSPKEIRDRSVVHVNQTILYDSNGDPVIGGLFDPRMGVLDHGKVCPTDGLDNRFCPGYFGHIELARPVYHVQFIPIIIKTLKCVCIRCLSYLSIKIVQKLKKLPIHILVSVDLQKLLIDAQRLQD